MPTTFNEILSQLTPSKTTLVAVSKTKPISAIEHLYGLGQRDFGENKVQEILAKYHALPKDIQWHLIGHLQTNKVKQIVSFIHLIHSVDSLKLLIEINNQAKKINTVVSCLLQIYIAKEDTKFGLSFSEAESLLVSSDYENMHYIKICGVMGLATNTNNKNIVRQEFHSLKSFYTQLKIQYFKDSNFFTMISMGMSNDYLLAIEEGSNMVRIGSLLFD